MRTKLIYLKTGEYIVTELIKTVDPENDTKVLNYLFTNPKQILTETKWEDNRTDKSVKVNVSLISWPQFTKTTEVLIYPDAVMAIVDPTEGLLQLYGDSLNG